MPPRRGAPSVNTLSPSEPGAASPSSRSVSPSAGFAQFLAKPTKWFNRSNSGGGSRSSITSEPRSSTSSGGRKPKISHPTDPRPLLDAMAAGDRQPNFSSRSVLDLSLSRTKTTQDHTQSTTSRTPSSPSSSMLSRGLGDLRNLSRKPWSKSVDDLGKISSRPTAPAALTPIDTSFHDKVEQYRTARSGSFSSSLAPSPTSSPTPSMNKHYPFPVITTSSSDLLSSSPPKHLGVFGGSSPLGSPAASPSHSPASGGQAHSRSHSFTPRLPSKLSSAKAGLVPPTPVRKDSVTSEREVDVDKERTLSGGSLGAGPSPRPPFPFNFGITAAPQTVDAAMDSTLVSTPLMAPPMIVEPESDDTHTGDKRTSQVLYHAGFINRLSDFSPVSLDARANHSYAGGAGLLAKGWKPFKLVLKGSKLYFYKPPSDRSAAIKELFPTELVALLEEEGLEDAVELDDSAGESEQPGRKGKEREEGRKKRAYWGRNTHPGLVRGNGIEKGTFEALIHEAVFATTFLASPDSSDVHAKGEEQQQSLPTSRYKPEWRDFSAAILLSLPSLQGRATFEAEFLRCCSTLVSGAEIEMKPEEDLRVRWLANQYLTYHIAPADSSAWENWRQSSIPDLPTSTGPTVSGVPFSSSTQALYAPSPVLPSSPQMDTSVSSPNLGTFSPRPDTSAQLMSIVESFGEHTDRHHAKPSSGRTPKAWWKTLEREGLSRDVLLSLDAQLVARSVYVYHREALRHVPENLTADVCVDFEVSDVNTAPVSAAAIALAPFLGTDERPHWLTKFILIQILVPEHAGAAPADERHAPTSRTHSRSEVISAWAKVGELCRRNGDECSWRAIVAALCSRPIARLDKVWKRVDVNALSIVQSWVHIQGHGTATRVNDPRMTPWAGDIKSRVRACLERARNEDYLEITPLLEIQAAFQELRTVFSLCPRKVTTDEPEDDDVQILVRHWRTLSTGSGGGLAAKFTRIEQFMSMSLAAEPRRKGLFEPYYWTRLPPHVGFHPLFPVLFPEPLPTVAFINRAVISRGRLESNASSINIQDLQYLRDVRLRPDGEGLLNAASGQPNGMDIGGTVIPIYEGELRLLAQPVDRTAPSRPASRAPSRPPSTADHSVERTSTRTPSIRVKPGTSQGLDRKTSVIRRNSLPSISARTSLAISESTWERPIRVVVQAGTLERLVGVLVHGVHGVSVSVADDNGEIPLSDTKTREVKVDMEEFSQVWWNTFRSFVTPHVFFELLRKRYVASQVTVQPPSAAEIIHCVQFRTEVLEAISEWLSKGGGAQDVLDDTQLYTSVYTFLNHPTDHILHVGSLADDPNIQNSLSLLTDMKNTLSQSFIAQTMRPLYRAPAHESATSNVTTHSFGVEPPNVDTGDIEDFVNSLDALATATFHNVTQEDLFVTADILEVQSADRTGWFLNREPNAIFDEVEIQTIYSHVLDIEPSSMISELGQDSVYRLLPPAVRSCIRAFGIIRRWIISHLVAPRIGLHARQNKMERMLQVIEVCRLRSSKSTNADVPIVEQPCVRSFVEAVVTSAVLSVESRTYHRAWQNVASSRKTTYDTLSALLGRPVVSSSSRESLTVDMGWLLERMLEIIGMPDVLEVAPQEAPSLINIDKRRSLHQLIMNALTQAQAHNSHRRRDSERQDFERLNNIEKELRGVNLDLRGIREDAYREATQVGASGSLGKNRHRPFHALVLAQQDKNKRDKYLRDRLSKEKRQEQQRFDRREEYLNKAMHTRRPAPPPQKQHRNKKSMSSAFFQFMRPISSAFTSEMTSGPGSRRTPAELDFTPSHKPILVLSVVDARVSQFINNERSFTFQLDTEDGGHYLLQAISKPDMKKWMDTIIRVSKIAAKRRLTYLGHNSKMQLSDHLLSNQAAVSQDPRAVYGVDLEFLLKREAPNGEIQPGAVPSVIERLISEVESRGLREIGIYRVAGAHSEVNAFREALNKGEWPITSSTDINAVCDLIKSWFRVLPGGMFPAAAYNQILEIGATNEELDLNTRLANIRTVVHSLSDAYFYLLRRLIEHLDKVTDYEENNQMTTDSLATVFSPNILRSANNDLGLFFANMSKGHRVTKTLITHFHTIFDDAEQDPEGELDQDQDDYEYDEPILEEDEGDEASLDPRTTDNVHEETISGPPVLDLEIDQPGFSITVASMT